MKNKLFLIHLVAVLVIVILAAWGGSCLGKYYNGLLEKQKTEMTVSAQDVLIKNEVQTAVSLLQTIYEKQQQGIYTMEKAKELGADLLRDLRYGENESGYFFADTTEGVNIVLYGSAVEGTNRYNASLNGVNYIQEILKNGAKPGGGYTDYWYPKKEQTAAKAKRAYSLLFSPFGWVVGTGYYLEDVK
ncbi:MAG: cache domain-containing protein [Candidatus Uhrbacteria bacterium]